MTATDGKIECPLCLLELPPVEFPDLGHCDHRACYECLQQYLRIEISESRVNMMCPECTEPIHPNDIRIILNDEEMLSKYESFMLRRVLVAEPDARWCPAPDCSYVVIASGCAGCPKLQCNRPGCNTFFCYHCKHEWHPNQTCDAARAQRNVRIASSRASGDFDGHSIHVSQRDSEIKPCPTCKVLVIKMDDGSCNHMTCSVCGTEFCWLCMKQITDLHYLSPSGCTFWGKKPWSRKKKILWQLGMLVGAPVGVALIAGIAVPAIIIGVPVWVGRKLHSRFERQSMRRHKRNLLIASGVVTSVLVTPILAAVAVGIGVPILLAYVYGVVPISLCRSGGCGGLNRSESDAKLDLEEGLANSSSKNANALDRLSVDTALSASRPNPSIGEMSFGLSASLYMGSGSHLDRAAGDRESASNAPLAGSIASHRVEVTADVSSNKRYSFSSGHSEAISCAVSLSERSANISNYDDLSVRGLAGSIMSRVHHGVTPVSNLSREDEVSSHVVTSPVETVITVEAQAVPPPPMTTSGRCVSFQPSALGGAVPAKSRSYELLNTYCEVCHSAHRPCCPNFTSPGPSQAIKVRECTQSPVVKATASKSVIKPTTRTQTAISVPQSSVSTSSRKSSVKSTSSDISGTSTSAEIGSKSEVSAKQPRYRSGHHVLRKSSASSNSAELN